MKKAAECTSPELVELYRARTIVERFVLMKQEPTILAFLEQYEGAQSHDAIRDAFRLYAPDISA